ncbi:MAG TPA: hypothetical protein VF796_27530 [Humisphaera sp.]
MPKPTTESLAAVAPQALRDLAANLRALGKEALADAAGRLQEQAPLAALWVAELHAARAVKDDAKLDELEATLDVLSADVAFAVADLGVRSQVEVESVLKLLGGTVLAAAAAAV